MSKLENTAFALLLALCCISAPASGASFTDELRARLTTARDTLDKLYLDLALNYALCGQEFRHTTLLGNTSQANETLSRAKQCQADMLAHGNAAIEKIKASLPKQGAQTALKDLTLYWRVQVSEVNNSYSEGDNFSLLKNLKAYTERIRLENDW